MNVRVIDLRFGGSDHVIAAYLIETPAGPVLVETGPGSTLGALRGGLAEYGYGFEDIGNVFVTHIHLDHSGGAWALAEAGATIHVPERGARHLADPARLIESAKMVYGDKFDSLWGQLRPVPESKIRALFDGEKIDFGGVQFDCWDSPGHARHHQIFGCGEIAFVGDAVGCRLPGEDHISLTSAPPQFDPEAWELTLDRLERAGHQKIFPTHYGPVDDVADHLRRFRKVVRDSSEFVRELVEDGVEDAEIRPAYDAYCKSRAGSDGVEENGWRRYESANPTWMCGDGIALYWRKKLEEGPSGVA